MPATLYTCYTNIRRIEEQGDPQMNKIRAKALKKWDLSDDTAHEIWEYIKDAADKAEIGDKIPGTVGRQYAAQYGKIQHRQPNPRLTIKLSEAGVCAVKAAGRYGKLIEYDLTWPAACLKDQTLVVFAPGAARDVLVRWAEEAKTHKEEARRRQVIAPMVRAMRAELDT